MLEGPPGKKVARKPGVLGDIAGALGAQSVLGLLEWQHRHAGRALCDYIDQRVPMGTLMDLVRRASRGAVRQGQPLAASCWPLAAIGALLLLLGGCFAPTELDVLVAPDSSRDGEGGRDGPLGAGFFSASTLARVDDLVRYEVLVPLLEDGSVAGSADASLPLVVMIHGGFVEVRRYRWLASHLATRGYVTVMADHDANLSFLSSANSTVAVDDLLAESTGVGHPLQDRLDPTAPASVLGHSLGGVAAATLWAGDPERWDVLGILASYPAPGTDVEQFVGRPSMHLVGSEDEPEAKREQGFERFGEPRILGIVDGMNHYAWTDEATARELAGDGPALRSATETRPDALQIIDTGLDAWMRSDPEALERLRVGVFPGVEVER